MISLTPLFCAPQYARSAALKPTRSSRRTGICKASSNPQLDSYLAEKLKALPDLSSIKSKLPSDGLGAAGMQILSMVYSIVSLFNFSFPLLIAASKFARSDGVTRARDALGQLQEKAGENFGSVFDAIPTAGSPSAPLPPHWGSAIIDSLVNNIADNGLQALNEVARVGGL